jgi:predicted ATP-grasp superfamily ATP-dependent carboligase
VAERILILGASARAAAASARRAGLEPFAIDLFCDRDTRLLCECLRCPPDEYPEGLFRLARLAPPMPWMYTGGLENYPELINGLARERELWGNGAAVLWRSRDPWVLDGLPPYVARFSEVCPKRKRPPTDRPYVRKPIRGSGGVGVRFAEPGDAAGSDVYFQEFIEGESRSTLCHAVTAEPTTLGISRQLVGVQWLHARPFQYSGSVTRPWIDNPVYSWDCDLCQATGLRGLFGLDFVAEPGEDRGREIVDVNPRYVASVEVHEFATGTSLLFRTDPPPPATLVVGKAIYFAPHRLTVPASGPWDDSLTRAADVWHRPNFADIPRPGEVIEPGHPVLTILAEGAGEGECLSRLQSQAAELDRLFGFHTPSGYDHADPE